jgi:hypothetical protein
MVRTLFFAACLGVWTVPLGAQAPELDPVTPLLQRFEQALNDSDRPAFASLFAPDVPAALVNQYTTGLLMPGAVKATIRERGRAQLEGAPPGDGFSLIVEFFVETPGRGRVLTANMDVRRPPGGDLASWRFVGAEGLSFIDGLYKLRLNITGAMAARDLEVVSEDLVLFLPSGTAFLVECDDGVTGLVLVGRGEMRFTPPAAAERGQLRLFSGDDTLVSPFDTVFVRLSPLDYEDRVLTSTLTPVVPGARTVRRAQEVFAREAVRSFNVDLQDLSPDAWYLLPASGDLLADVDTRRFDTLTYTLSAEQAEDISVFRRKDRRTLSLYPSVGKLSARGRFYSDDELREYDVLDYDVEAAIDPRRQALSGRTRLLIRVRTTSLASIKLRLADSLSVTGVTSVEYGRLLHLRMRSQNMVLVNLPRALSQDADITLVVTYVGSVESQEADTDTVAVAADPGGQLASSEAMERVYLLSNQAYWYPQNPVPDYAPASIRIVVPEGYSCVASGHPLPVDDTSFASDALGGREAQAFEFRASQPLRYLAVLVSRLRPGGEALVRIENQVDPGSGVDSVALTVQTHSSLRHRAASTTDDARAILGFYAGLMRDAPYTSAAVAIVESDLPGGHSPGYFAVINTPVSNTDDSWRRDPASFANYPEFFLAHELAHQWWGQAVGWKNYHEQWISEGFSQYFAALYAREARGDRLFDEMLRQFRRWALSESDQGPVHLGARLGHVKSDPRVFRALVYNKGAAVLHMLRRLLGDDVFFAGLRRFYLDRRYQKAGTEDFERALEAESGVVLDRFFERWIYGSGIPRVRYDAAISDREVLIRFEQTGDLVFDIPVTVSLTFADGQSEHVMVAVTASTVERSIPIEAGTVVRRVEVNRDWAALAEFDER